MTYTIPCLMVPDTPTVYETLFITKSGIIVQQPSKHVRTHHMLVWKLPSNTYWLNNKEIDRQAYNRILVDLQVNHPDACAINNEHNLVLIYPIENSQA